MILADNKTSMSENRQTHRSGKAIPFGEALYSQVMNFLIEEAHLLDEGLFAEWLGMLADDILCTMPVRQSVHRRRGDGSSRSSLWLREDMTSLTFKAERFAQSNTAWAEDPPSRTRRMITNLRLSETSVEDEYLAQSYLLIQRNRGDHHNFDFFSARRDDILRRMPEGWRLARRTILVDQAVLGQTNLAIFI